jgi:toxin ParE1/3/4
MRVHWTRGARVRLKAIHDYIAEDSKRQALRVVDRITRKTQILALHPRIGAEVPEYGDDSIRELLYRSYRIIYRILPDRIDVIAVIHGARPLPHHPPID